MTDPWYKGPRPLLCCYSTILRYCPHPSGPRWLTSTLYRFLLMRKREGEGCLFSIMAQPRSYTYYCYSYLIGQNLITWCLSLLELLWESTTDCVVQKEIHFSQFWGWEVLQDQWCWRIWFLVRAFFLACRQLPSLMWWGEKERDLVVFLEGHSPVESGPHLI